MERRCIRIVFMLLFFCLLWSNNAFASQPGKFIYPVGDGSKPKNVSGLSGWDNFRVVSDDIGYYDAQIFDNWNADYNGRHTGLDLNGNLGGENDCGNPVFAAADGVVIESGVNGPGTVNSSGWGNFIRIKHDFGTEVVYSLYAHLLSRNVSSGQSVVKGQRIGAIGSTGASSSCHLHFGILQQNTNGLGYPPSIDTSLYHNPDDFIASHPIKRYSYRGDVTACAVAPTGGMATNWLYSCPEPRSYYRTGDKIWVLLRLNDVLVDHRYKVKAYRNGVFQWDWTSSPNDVTNLEQGWQYSHFWPTLEYALPGEWKFDVYFQARDSIGDGTYIDSSSFVVTDKYQYDGNAYTCLGPVTGGEETNWIYSCANPKTLFSPGENVSSLLRINNVMANHRFRLEAFKENISQWSWQTNWRVVPQWGWETAFFWPEISNPQPGKWRVNIAVDEGAGFVTLSSIPFVVANAPVPFVYNHEITTCKGPVTGGEETNWIYTCQNPTKGFAVGDTAYTLVRINTIQANHSWRVEVYKGGVYQWEWTTDWRTVGFWGWNTAFFWPTLTNIGAGSWEFRILVNTGNGYQYIDSSQVVVD